MTSSAPLAVALNKLAGAINAAEAAVAAHGQENAAGRQASTDSAPLEAAMAELRRDHANLKSVADDVANRLDGAIEQVEAILSGRV